MKRKPRRGKKGALWLKVLDLGLILGFSAPILRHLGALSLPLALAEASLGLLLALAALWLSQRAAREKPHTPSNKGQGGSYPWWS